MADNTPQNGTGIVATDEVTYSGDISDVQLNRIVNVQGAEGSKTVISGVSPYNEDTDAAGFRPIGQKTYVCSFADSGSGLVTSDMTQLIAGTGITVSQSSGNLVVATGTSTNAEFLAKSVATFNGAFQASYNLTLSQRIANNNFAFILADSVGDGLAYTINSATQITVTVPNHKLAFGTTKNVGQFMFIGALTVSGSVPGRYAISSVPDANTIVFTVSGFPASGSGTCSLFGWNHYKLLYNGTLATALNFDAQRRGWASGDTVVNTINTTAAANIMRLDCDGRQGFLHDNLPASGTGAAATSRASRFQNLPDQNVQMNVYVWSYNGTTAPASTTTMTLGFWAVEDMPNLPVFLAGSRMLGNQSAFPVSIANTPTVNTSAAAGTNLSNDVGIQYRAGATGAASVTSIISPLTPTGGSIKASAGKVVGFYLSNKATSARFVKFYNATAVTMGTTAAAFEIPIPANGIAQINLPGGLSFATGIMWAVTSASGLTDNTTTGLAANDVSGFVAFA